MTELIYLKHKSQIEKQMIDLCVKLASSDNDIDMMQAIIIAKLFEIVIEICFKEDLGCDDGKFFIEQFLSNLSVLNKTKLPGAIWQEFAEITMSKFIGGETSEFKTNFNFVHMKLLAHKFTKTSCCC